jgi:Endoplasmic reticulum vesicle transporter/Endoplasmic Reticulum-Golgi Intermediate Compartment (ERGIC)
MAFRNVDVFIKPRADIRSKSVAGGIITVVAGTAACLLFFAQLYLYIAGNKSHSLHLAPSSPFPMLPHDKNDPFQSRAYDIKGKMPLKIHVTFLHITCDAIEIKLNGSPVSARDLSARSGALKKMKPNAAEIKKIFGSATSAEAQAHAGRGCTLSGTLRVPIVAGSVSVTLTRDAWATALNHFMIRAKQPEEVRKLDTHMNDYNMSHFIHNIQFGKNIPSSVMTHSSATSSSYVYEEPMRDHVHIIENQMGGIALESIQVKLVPTVHTGLFSENTYMQMSVVEHTVQPETMISQGVSSQPGLSLTYDITPLAVHQNEGRDNILIFLSSLCGIVGGVFVTVSLLTGCLVHSAAAVAKKVD